jgi:two-component system cell cycle sensor histidine kinase/response regulator CckA
VAKILVVDDQPANREVLVALLQYGGHQILEAGDGAEALEIASENRPDLVITDILMPAMDGYELVKRLRGNRSIAGTPVIYYTAHYLEQEALALAEKSGVAHVLPKPFEPEQVWSVVQAALGLERAPAPPPPAEQFDREHLGLVTNKLSQKASELRLANLRFRALIELGQQLNSELDPAALVRSYTRAAREIVGAERAMVRLTGQDPPGVFTSGFQDGETARLLDAFRRPGLLRDVESGSEARMVRSLDGEPLESGAPGVAIHSLLAAPIASPGRRYGWLYAFNKLGKPEFTELEGQLAQMLAGHLAVGYEKARLDEEAGRRAAALEREVAERARAEKALRERESRYRMLMEQASDGIVIFDAAGELTEANPAFCAMLGASREELLGKKIAAFFPAEDAPFELGAAGDQGGERRARKERRLARRDGKLVVGQIGASILADGCMQLIVRDISDSRALEEQLRQAQKMEAIGRLAGGVAHDFNNLLTAIMGYGEVALATLPADTELHSNIKEILIIADRAAVLTSQLLACSRRQVMRPKVLNLNSVVANMTKLCARVLGEQIELIINLAENLRPVKADPGMIEQVILNLAVNASDAMPAGGKLVISTGNIDIDEDYLRTHLGFQRHRLRHRRGRAPANFRTVLHDQGSG